MKFYKIKEDRIINLDTIRTVQLHENEIYLSYTCGDGRSERLVFRTIQTAADAFDKLCDELGVEVKNED